jgi:hypothetical protein
MLFVVVVVVAASSASPIASTPLLVAFLPSATKFVRNRQLEFRNKAGSSSSSSSSSSCCSSPPGVVPETPKDGSNVIAEMQLSSNVDAGGIVQRRITAFVSLEVLWLWWWWL